MWRLLTTLNYRRRERIYILPSGRGLLFLLLIVVIVMVGATYNNNLIFILAFLLFALFVVGMVETHVNLKGVTLELDAAEEGFAGETLALLFHVRQRRKGVKRQLRVRCLQKDWALDMPCVVDLAQGEYSKSCRLMVRSQQRGVFAVPRVTLETYFPIGFFRAWKVIRPAGEVIVYPTPQGHQALPPSPAAGPRELGLRPNPEGDFGELKPHLEGESIRHIAWKHFARTGQMYTRVHWGEEHLHFAILEPAGHDIESRLSQMSAWVRLALDQGATLEMQLSRLAIPIGRGEEHARACWRTLAAFKEGT